MIVCLLAVLFAACDDKDDNKTVTYTVTFDTDGGEPAPPEQRIEKGKTATEPAAPSKSGADFVHWTNTAEGTAYDFSQPVNAHLDLKAIYMSSRLVISDDGPFDDGTIVDDADPPVSYEVQIADVAGKLLTTQTLDSRVLAMPPDFAKTHGFADGDTLTISVKAYKTSACVADPDCTLKDYSDPNGNNYDRTQDPQPEVGSGSVTAAYNAAVDGRIDVPMSFNPTGIGLRFRLDGNGNIVGINKPVSGVTKNSFGNTPPNSRNFVTDCIAESYLFGRPSPFSFGCLLLEHSSNEKGGIMVYRKRLDPSFNHARIGFSVEFTDKSRYYTIFDGFWNKYFGEEIVLDISAQQVWQEGDYPPDN